MNTSQCVEINGMQDFEQGHDKRVRIMYRYQQMILAMGTLRGYRHAAVEVNRKREYGYELMFDWGPQFLDESLVYTHGLYMEILND